MANKNNKNNKKRFENKDKDQKDFNPRYPRKNDPSWYTKFTELAKVSGLYNYGFPLGQIMNYGKIISSDLVRKVRSIPGVMKIELMPAIGYSTDNNSPVNNMARMVYSYIRHANSGSRNFEAPDLMTYFLALGSAYAFYASLVRLYGIMRAYSVENLYIPKAYCEILGFDYNDIVKHLADLRSYIGYFAARINQFAVPKDMAYFEHMLFMPLNVFLDFDNPKGSLYLFDFDVLFKWSGTSSRFGSELVTTDWGIISNKTFDIIFNKGEEIINALTLNEDIGIMSGDVLKAKGSSGVHELPIISEDYVTNPIYDENILWQIHNARVIDALPSEWSNFKVSQTGGALIFNPTLDRSPNNGLLALNGMEYLLDCGVEEPTVDENFENTRLHYRGKWTLDADSGRMKFAFDSVGTMFVARTSLWYYERAAEDAAQSLTYFVAADAFIYQGVTAAVVTNLVQGYTLVSTFKHKPITYCYIKEDSLSVQGVDLVCPFGDLHNFTQVSDNIIAQLHRTALLSEFYVPNMAQAYK